MINAAKSYIVKHGRDFNPTKTICKTFGTCNFEKTPKWYLNGSLLHSDNSITYLCTALTGNVTDHINTRIQAARRACYGLQSSGVCCDGVTPETLSHIYKVSIQPILTYGCSAVNIDNFVECMYRVQGMLIKIALDLPQELTTLSCPWY